MSVSYFKELHCGDGTILSIDKIVLDGCFYFGYSDDGFGYKFMERFFDYLRRESLTFLVDYEFWESSKMCGYRNQFKLLCEENNSCWLGVGFNSFCNDDNGKHKRKWRLEFNPNKVYNVCFILSASPCPLFNV